MHWIGVASATGILIDIPVIIRSLARNLVRLPRLFDLPFLLALDAGNHPSHPTGTVEQYHLDWWSSDQLPMDDQLLKSDTLFPCLEIHREARNSTGTSTGINTGDAHSTGAAV